MKLREIGSDLSQLIISSEQALPRAHGTHVSDVIDYLRKTLGKTAEWEEHQLETSAQLGRIWERIVAGLIAAASLDGNRYVRPDPVECDGVIGSPDGLDLRESAVIEYKCTWRSARKRIDQDFPYYWWQVKSYCWMTGCDLARLYVLFINGDYKGAGPVVKGWEAHFSDQELKANWKMIMKAKEEMEHEHNSNI